jgi:hypothetical protein
LPGAAPASPSSLYAVVFVIEIATLGGPDLSAGDGAALATSAIIENTTSHGAPLNV